MKHLLLVPLMALMASLCFAQSQTLPQKLKHFYAPLDKGKVQTGYLYDLSWSFASPSQYRGVLTDTNYVSPDVFGMLYGAMRGSSVASTNSLPSPEVYLSKIKSLSINSPIPMAAMALRYDRIHPNAVNDHLLSITGGQLFDVPGQVRSPYFQDTLFVATLLSEKTQSRSVSFSFPNDLLFNNLGDRPPVISFNPGDGRGWRNISAGQNIALEYPTTGQKEVVFRFEYPNLVRYSHSKLVVEEVEVSDRTGGMTWPQELYESMHVSATESYLGSTSGATLHIFYNTNNCNGAKRIIRPLIVVEGYEEPGIVGNTYERMFSLLNAKVLNGNSENLTDYLYPYEYDLIYVDFDNGSDYIQRNAFVVKEVITLVNEMKEAAGSLEQNVIIGVSMGGMASKYALLDMQTNGPNHDTRLFFTYDSPLRGANIPIATQCLVKFMVDNLPTYAGDDISIPSLSAIWDALQAPVPRQLLKYHVNGLVNGSGLDNVEHAAFMAELDGLGGLDMRHVALSNGSGTGTFIENNIVAGALFFELDGQKVVCELISLDPFLIVCGDVRFSLRLRATGGNGLTTLFYGFIEKDTPNPFPPSPISTTWIVNEVSKPYDSAPGGTSHLGTAPLGNAPGGLMASLAEAGVSTSGPGLTATHHCFIPTFSAVSASEPSNLGTPVTCGTPSRCSTSSTAETHPDSGLPEFNQNHVYLDERIADVLIEELVTNSLPPFVNPLGIGLLETYFNVGLAIYSPIPTLTIRTGFGKLSINNTLGVAYATPNDRKSPHQMLVADTECDAVITVENNAKLVIGADGAVKDGVLRVNEGATVHIKAGGMLSITGNNSQLYIKHGAKLIIDPNAIVVFETVGANILIEGELVVNGDFKFIGPGFFDFSIGNKLTFGPGYTTFNLKGTGKDKRFVRFSDFVGVDAGHRLNWSNGLVEVADFLQLTDGAGLNFTNMTLTGIGSGTTVIDALNTGIIQLERCDVRLLDQAIVGKDGQGCIISASNFSAYNDSQVKWENAAVIQILYSVFDGSGSSNGMNALWFENVFVPIIKGSSFQNHGEPVSAVIDDNDLLDEGAAIELFDVAICLVTESNFTNNSLGIKSRDFDRPSNVYVYGGCTFTDNGVGVFVNGDQTRGTVLSDCSLYDKNRTAIRGRDITLMIDSWNSSSWSFDTDSPNRFIRNGFGAGFDRYIRICYDQKGVGGSNLMRNNFWGEAINPDPNPETNIFLQNAACLGSTAPVVQPTAKKDPECLPEERPLSFAPAAPGTECPISAVVSPGRVAPVHEQFQLGAFLLRTENYDAGIEALRPVAALWQPDMLAVSANCQQYIKVAKAIVDGNDLPGLPRPGGSRDQVVSKSELQIAPNPAHGSAIVYCSNEQYQVKIWDLQGRLMHQAEAIGNHLVETAEWPAGIYLVEAITPDGTRKNGKLIVQ